MIIKTIIQKKVKDVCCQDDKTAKHLDLTATLWFVPLSDTPTHELIMLQLKSL